MLADRLVHSIYALVNNPAEWPNTLFNHWQVEAERIICPTTIWHGLADRQAPAFLMRRFQQALPNCIESHWLEDEGLYLLFGQWERIASRLP